MDEVEKLAKELKDTLFGYETRGMGFKICGRKGRNRKNYRTFKQETCRALQGVR